MDQISIEVLEGEPCVRIVKLEAEASHVASLVNDKVRQLKGAQVPGFRPGKVPLKLIRRRHAAQIDQDVIQSMIQDSLPEIFKRIEAKPASAPRFVEGDVGLVDGKTYSCILHVDTMPTFDVPEYKGVEIKQMPGQAVDEQIDRQIEQILRQHATYDDVERPAAEGDLLSIRYAIKEKPKTDHSCSSLEKMFGPDEEFMEVGARAPLPGLETAVIGMSKDEPTEVTIEFPEGWDEAVLAGKSFAYEVEVLKVSQVTLPELTDEWVKEMVRLEGIQDLRDRIAESASQEAERMNRELSQAQIMGELTKDQDFPLPPSMLRNEEESVLRRLARNKHMHSEEEMQEFVESVREEVEETAANNLRGRLVLQAIAEAEEIKADDDAVQHGVAQMRMQMLQAGREEDADPQAMEETVRFNQVLESTINRILELANVTEFSESDDATDNDESSCDKHDHSNCSHSHDDETEEKTGDE